MLTEFEGKVVKAIETIAECLVKSNEMAEEALKKSNQLYGANMAMKKESLISPDYEKFKEIYNSLQTPDSNTPTIRDEDDKDTYLKEKRRS